MSSASLCKTPKLAPNLDALANTDVFIDDEELNLGVAHDGSIAARAGLKFCMEYLAPLKQNATIDVVHIYDPPAQESLPRNYKKDTIQAELNAHDLAKGDRFLVHMLKKTEDEKEGKSILRWSLDQEQNGRTLDFVFMGFKGRKDAPEEELLASDVSYALGYLRCSTVILRQELDVSAGKLHYVVPVDLNKWSEKALFDALMLSSEADKITVLHIRIREEETAQTAEYYEKLVNRLGQRTRVPRAITFQCMRHGGEGAAKDILEFCKENGADVICMGTNVDRLRTKGSYLGSIMGAVLLGTRLPVVVARYDENFASVVSTDSRPDYSSLLPPAATTIFRETN